MPSLWSSLILYVEIGVLAAFHKIGASMRRDPASGIFCFWILVWLLEKLNQKGNQEQFRAHVWGMCEWSLRNYALVLREPNMRTGAIQLSAPKASHKPLTKTLKTIYERF